MTAPDVCFLSSLTCHRPQVQVVVDCCCTDNVCENVRGHGQRPRHLTMFLLLKQDQKDL